MSCERVDLDADVTLTFRGCKDHGHFELVRGAFHSGGVDPFDLIDGVLTVVVETLTHVVSQYEPIQEMIGYKSGWAWSDEGVVEELPDRAKRRIVKALAQQMLLRHVAGGDYMKDLESAALELPFISD